MLHNGKTESISYQKILVDVFVFILNKIDDS